MQAAAAIVQLAGCQADLRSHKLATAFIHAVENHLQRLTRGNPASLVIDVTRGIQAQRLPRRNQSCNVIQGRQLQRDLRLARQLAIAADQLPDTCSEVAGAGDQAALGVEQLVGVDSEAAGAEDEALVLVVQGCGFALRLALSAQRAALVGEFARGDTEVAAGDHGLASVVEGLCIQAHVALGVAGVAAVIGVDARFDNAVVGQPATGVQGDAVFNGERLLVDQSALGFDRLISARMDRAFGLDALRLEVNRRTGRGLAHDYIASGINLDITTGDHITRQPHAQTGLGADQLDRDHIHAAERRGVNRQIRRLAAVRCACRGVQGARVDVVATGDYGEFFCLDLCVDVVARVIISTWSTLLAFRPAPSMATLPLST